MPPRRPGPDVDVAVVGAGLAGLAAAQRLQEAGREPVVFEATDRVGGRQRSTRLAGQVLEEGAVFFGSNYPTLTAKLRETGLDADLKLYEKRRIGRFGCGRETARDPLGLLTTPYLPWTEKLALVPFAVSMAPIEREIRRSLGGRVRSRRVRRLDGVSASAWLSARVGPRFVDEVAGPFTEALGFAPARDWSALGAVQILAFGAMAELYGIREGNSVFAQRLGAGLDVRLGHRAASVAPDPGGVGVEFAGGALDGTVRARDLVLAVPAPVASGLLHGALAQAVGRFCYSSSVVIAAAVTSLAIDLPAVSIFGGEGHGRIRGVVAERAGDAEPVVAYAALAHPWQYELFDAADADVVPVLTGFLAEANGGPVDVLESRVVRWRHAVPVPVPGSWDLRVESRRLAAEVPHLHVAGDWLVSPSQEGALVSGIAAADALVGA